MKRVILESPFSAKSGRRNVYLNIEYARACVRDSVLRGEAPLASHLLFTQPGILDDTVPEERSLGMAAGFSWLPVAESVVAYIDHGISQGMTDGLRKAEEQGLEIEYRRIL